MLVSQSGMSGPRLAVERILRELADAAQRADELRCLDREEDGLAVRAGRELADRLDIFLRDERSEEHTSELQSLMRISYAVFCLKKKQTKLRILRHLNGMIPVVNATCTHQ